MNQQRWPAAAAAFSRAAASSGSNADAALYWKAYSFEKLGKPALVTATCTQLQQLAREEKNLDRKRAIVSQLALMQDKVATDYMLELLK